MRILLISYTLLLVCTSLPLTKISAISQINKNQQPPPHAIIHQKHVSLARSVTKFKSTHQPSQLDWFNNLKQAIADSNISVTTSNTSTFNMNIKYSGFNSFGINIKHVVKSVGGNLNQPNLNIGLSQLSQVQVQVPDHSLTWDKYIEDSDDTLNYSKVSVSSITYKIVATGSIHEETVTFVMSYAPRNAKATDKKVDLQLGHFDVYNENTNDKKYWESTGGGIAAGVLLVVVLAVIGTVLAWNRASIRRYFTAQWVGDPIPNIPNIPNISNGEGVLGKTGTTADDTLKGELPTNVLKTPTEQDTEQTILSKAKVEQRRLEVSKYLAKEKKTQEIVDRYIAEHEDLKRKGKLPKQDWQKRSKSEIKFREKRKGQIDLINKKILAKLPDDKTLSPSLLDRSKDARRMMLDSGFVNKSDAAFDARFEGSAYRNLLTDKTITSFMSWYSALQDFYYV